MKYTREALAGRQLSKSDFLFFWGHQPGKGGSIGKGCLSQWWPCQFEKDGIPYTHTEQWMMAEKARLFLDEACLAEILASDSPKEMKIIGRRIRNFDSSSWDQNKYAIVLHGNYLKFSQTEDLKEFLLNTNELIIVEASPYDKIWGTGLAGKHEYSPQPDKWPGLNLLGFALMEVRDHLRLETVPTGL